MEKRKFDLEERLIEFSVNTIGLTESMFNTRAGNHIAGQLVRSCTSPALHYGEAQSAESKNDFIHKLKLLLKELRESLNALKITQRVPLSENQEQVQKAMKECNELISIFVKSIETARMNKTALKSS